MIDVFQNRPQSRRHMRVSSTINPTFARSSSSKLPSVTVTGTIDDYQRSRNYAPSKDISYNERTDKKTVDSLDANIGSVQQNVEKEPKGNLSYSMLPMIKTNKHITISQSMHNTITGLHLRTSSRQRRTLTVKILVRYILIVPIIFSISKIGLPLIDTVCLSYGVIALILRIDGRLSLIGSLVTILCLPVLELLKYQLASDAFAEVAFYLLCVGVVAMAIESFAQVERRVEKIIY